MLGKKSNYREMMLFVVKDCIADDVSPVYEAVNEAVAKRAFKGMLKKNEIANVDDYKLIKVGVIDNHGKIKVYYEEIDLKISEEFANE